MDSRTQKTRLRVELRGRRESLTARELAVAAKACAIAVTKLPEWKQAKTVCLYASFGRELTTDPLIEIALTAEKRLLLPRISGEGVLTLHVVTDLAQLKVSALGIREPKPSAPTAEAKDAGLILVPGLGFDARGRRLGQGAGYYDRLLARLPKKCFLVGHCHAFQLASSIPTEPHDIKVMAVATPQGVIRCRPR